MRQSIILAGLRTPALGLLHVGYEPALDRWQFDNLSAPYWRLYANGCSGASVCFEGTITALDPDRIILIPPDTPFATRLAHRVEHLYLHAVLETPDALVRPAVYSIPRSAALGAQLDALRTQLAAPVVDRAALMLPGTALVLQALAALPPTAMEEHRPGRRIAQSLRHIRANLHRRVPNDELARAAGMHTNAFIRLFHARVGQPPQAYALARRIEHAARLLHVTGSTIDDIATATGFADRYHFSRAFRRLRGVSPAAFRRANA